MPKKKQETPIVEQENTPELVRVYFRATTRIGNNEYAPGEHLIPKDVAVSLGLRVELN